MQWTDLLMLYHGQKLPIKKPFHNLPPGFFKEFSMIINIFIFKIINLFCRLFNFCFPVFSFSNLSDSAFFVHHFENHFLVRIVDRRNGNVADGSKFSWKIKAFKKLNYLSNENSINDSSRQGAVV